jgi:hypothetical protein
MEQLPGQIHSFHLLWFQGDTLLPQDLTRDGFRIPVTRIWPIRNLHDTLAVVFTDYWVSLTGSTFNYALEGGCTVRFTYDCEAHDFRVCQVELWGV